MSEINQYNQSFLEGLQQLEENICNYHMTPTYVFSLQRPYFDNDQQCHPLMLVLRTILISYRDVMACCSVRFGVLLVIRLIRYAHVGSVGSVSLDECNDDGIPLRSIADVFVQMTDKCKDIIADSTTAPSNNDGSDDFNHDMIIKVDILKNNRILRNIISTLVHEHADALYLFPDEYKTILETISATFLNSTHCSTSLNTSGSNIILYEAINGRSTSNTCTYFNTLFMDIFSDPNYDTDFPLNTVLTNVKIALFNESLTLNSDFLEHNDINVHIHSDSMHGSPSSMIHTVEYELINKFVDILKRGNVTLVGCQKLIHPYLKDKLYTAGIYYIERISLKYMGVLQTLCGGTILGNMNITNADMETSTNGIKDKMLGYASTVSKRIQFDKKYIIVSNEEEDRRTKSISTTFIAAYAEHQCKILQHDVFEPCLLTLSKARVDPSILALDWPNRLAQAIRSKLSAKKSRGIYKYSHGYVDVLVSCWHCVKHEKEEEENSDSINDGEGTLTFSLPRSICLSLLSMVKEAISVVIDVDTDIVR